MKILGVIAMCIVVIAVVLVGNTVKNRMNEATIRNRERTQSSTPKTPVSTWYIQRYVDDFGDVTSKRYMSPKNIIHGTFSNSATIESHLQVDFAIDFNKKTGTVDIRIFLYEYGKRLATSYGEDGYRIRVKTDKGTVHEFTADQPGVSLQLRDNSQKLHNLFLKYRTLRFYIRDRHRPTSQYLFEIDATGYTATYKRLSRQNM